MTLPVNEQADTKTDWLEMCRQEFNRRYFYDDCGFSLADRPSVSREAVPCATKAEQHEPQRAA